MPTRVRGYSAEVQRCSGPNLAQPTFRSLAGGEGPANRVVGLLVDTAAPRHNDNEDPQLRGIMERLPEEEGCATTHDQREDRPAIHHGCDYARRPCAGWNDGRRVLRKQHQW